jgi:hypothetical protein
MAYGEKYIYVIITASTTFHYDPADRAAFTGGVNFLIVGGGGSGGSGGGGGGGAGGAVAGTIENLPIGDYPIVIGNGGAAVSGDQAGNNGGNSSFYNMTAVGGGGGCGWAAAAKSGGCGGGSSYNYRTGGASTQTTYSDCLTYGTAGSNFVVNNGGGNAGGGLGGGGIVDAAVGGPGIAFGNFYGGGGAGGERGGAIGGSGIGGTGGIGSSGVTSGLANTGSGGGGSGGGAGYTSGAGGSGVVILRFLTPYTFDDQSNSLTTMIISPVMNLYYNRWPQFYYVNGMGDKMWVVDQSGRVYSYTPSTGIMSNYLWAIDGTNIIGYNNGHIIFGNINYIYQITLGGGYSGESHLRKFRTSDGVTVLNDPAGSVTSWHRMNHKQVVQTGDNKIYIINFTNSDSYNPNPKRVIVYDPVMDIADTSAPFVTNSNAIPVEYKSGEGNTGGAIAVGLIGKIFIFGGIASKRVCILDPSNFTYTFGLYDDFTCPLFDVHTVRYGPMTSAPYIGNSCIYFYGGYYNDSNNDNHYFSTIIKFDPLAASGSQWTSFGKIRNNTTQMSAFSYYGQSYLAGGYLNGMESQYIYILTSIYDAIKTNLSTTLPKVGRYSYPNNKITFSSILVKVGRFSYPNNKSQYQYPTNYRIGRFQLPCSNKAQSNYYAVKQAQSQIGIPIKWPGNKPLPYSQSFKSSKWTLPGKHKINRKYPSITKVISGTVFGDNKELIGTASSNSPIILNNFL